MATVEVPIDFGEWQKGPHGELTFNVLVKQDVSTVKGQGEPYVMLRIAVVKGPDHLRGIIGGSDKPIVLQLKLRDTGLARSMANSLVTAADLLEGRATPAN
jgi:hypothetical protein